MVMCGHGHWRHWFIMNSKSYVEMVLVWKFPLETQRTILNRLNILQKKKHQNHSFRTHFLLAFFIAHTLSCISIICFLQTVFCFWLTPVPLSSYDDCVCYHSYPLFHVYLIAHRFADTFFGDIRFFEIRGANWWMELPCFFSFVYSWTIFTVSLAFRFHLVCYSFVGWNSVANGFARIWIWREWIENVLTLATSSWHLNCRRCDCLDKWNYIHFPIIAIVHG